MKDRAELEELLAVEALGGLEPADRARLHELLDDGDDRDEVAQLRAEFSDTAALLGTGLAPTPLSADLEHRTVTAALAPAAPALAPARRWRAALVAIAAALLVAVGVIAGYVAAPTSDVEAFINAPGATFIPFEASPGGTGTMTLVVAADGQSGYVIGAGVSAPPSGDVYELWTIQGKTPTSLGCLVPDDGVVRQKVTGDFGTSDVAAMTVESSACPPAPTSDPVQIATL